MIPLCVCFQRVCSSIPVPEKHGSMVFTSPQDVHNVSIHTHTVEYYKISKREKENKERRRRRRRLSKTGRSAFSQRILPLDRPAIDSHKNF